MLKKKEKLKEEVLHNEDECHCHEEACDCYNDECDCHECDCDDECCQDGCCSEEGNDQLEDEVTKLNNKIKELEEKNLRDKAELINYRRRKDEEIIRMLKYCHEDIILEILPTLDNFERAVNMDDDNLEDEVSKFLAGFKMIYSNLKNTLNKYDIKEIDGTNKPFDPTYHQAMMTEKKEGVEPGFVIEILQKGYILKDRVIRPAMVKVSE